MRGRIGGIVFWIATLAGCGSDNPVAGLSDGGTPVADTGMEMRAFEITTTTLPNGMIEAVYSARVEATGGVLPYRFELSANESLPSGLLMRDDGTIEGRPTAAGSATFVVVATDGASPPATAMATLSLSISPRMGEPLVITTIGLPMGTAAEVYDAQLTATGGVMPYVWSIGSGALPSGLSLSADGAIRGTPLGAGSSSFLVQVTDGSTPNQIATRSFTITVKPAIGTPLIIETTTLPDGTVDAAYTAMLAASGGTPPYNWSLAAGTSLPSGMVLASTGEITGAPVQAGAVTFTVQVIDSGNPSQLASAQLTITILPGMGTPLEITTASLPDAMVGQTYTTTLAASGGTPPYTFSISAGALPPGLTFLPTGELGGAALQPGTFAFTVQCNDAGNPAQVATRSLSITVIGLTGDPLSITTAGLPDGMVSQAYMAQLTAVGGMTPYQWALDPASSLPSGLALDTTGAITGTPDTAGRFGFTVLLVDSSMPQQTASAALTITIAPAPGSTLQITTATLPNATVGVAYMQMLLATGGTTPYAWSLVQGTLPAGFSLDAGGLIAGTTMVAGSYGFTVEVTDASMPTERAQATFTLVVNPPANRTLVILTNGLPRATVRTSYRAQLAAAGGAPPYTWALEAGALPAGLTLTSTGAIWGAATVAGSFSFTVSVTDSDMATAQKLLSLVAFTRPSGGLAILNQNLPSGTAGRPYSSHFAAAGGTRPYTFSISAGALPFGLNLDTTGRITGTATAAGAFPFTARVTDTSTPAAQQAERSYVLTIRSGVRRLRLVTRQLPEAMVGVSYSEQMQATGGTPPYLWSVANGMLPVGLTLSSTGAISGTPTTPGNDQVTFGVTDTGNPPQSATRMINLRVRP